MQKSSNEINESDEKCQENNQEEGSEEISFLFNEEECEGSAEDSVWLQCDKCNFWANVHCILHTAEQEATEKMLTCSTDLPKLCIGMLKNLFVVKGRRKLFYGRWGWKGSVE